MDTVFSPTLLAMIGLLLGAIIGSFLNVVIYRLPLILRSEWSNEAKLFLGMAPDDTNSLSLSTPRSRCPDCGTQLKAIHNIPVLSYCFLRGRCSNCNSLISIQYPLIELLSAFLTAYILISYGLSDKALFCLIFTYSLIALAVIDMREQILPDQITLPLLWLGLILSLAGYWTNSFDAIIGASIGYMSLWSVMKIFKLITGKEGMGYGDFKLNAAIGAWLGWQMVPTVILLSSFLGAVIGLFAIVFLGHDRRSPFAFGPYLCLAGWVTMQWGDQLGHLFSYLSI
ncbi:prepilin peptidase [Porticoccaceae bacterium]|nr:prepilin peptidase [Porticoccaceae bacterium]